MIEVLGKAKALNVAFLSTKKQPVTVPVPLAGFTAAYRKIQ